jgi:nucleoside-diphosphate-sugar epimerase
MNHIVVTGGAGFLGSHLCRALLDRGDRVTAVDNFSTGRRSTIAQLVDHPRFTLRTADINTLGCFADLDRVTHIVHLARPGSPVAAARHPVTTLRTSSTGTLAALDLAAAHGARIVLASGAGAREGPRELTCGTAASVHTAGNHLIESAARHYRGTDTGIVRPFEVYGPHLWPGDGRATAVICAAAIRDQTLYLTGHDTPHLVYVTDAVDAITRMLAADDPGPIDIAGPAVALTEFARAAIDLTGTGWLETTPTTDNEPGTPPPDLTCTHTTLGWRPTTALGVGLHHTLDWMRTALSATHLGLGRADPRRSVFLAPPAASRG